MYEQLYKKGVGGFAGSGYWSSSESIEYSAWNQGFGNGGQDYYNKDDSRRVRCARAL